MVATILLACGVLALVKTGGFTASTFKNDLHWRWTKTAEDRLVTKSGSEPGALPPAPHGSADPAETARNPTRHSTRERAGDASAGSGGRGGFRETSTAKTGGGGNAGVG